MELNMKNVVFGVIALILAFSCQSPVQSPSSGAAPATPAKNLGTVTFSLNTPARSLSNANAASQANNYEVLIYDPTQTNVSFDIQLPTTNGVTSGTVNIPAGTYNILALAGYGTITPYLLGLTKVSNCVVAAGTVTPVTLTLQAISETFSCPSTMVCGGTYTISQVTDFHVPGFTYQFVASLLLNGVPVSSISSSYSPLTPSSSVTSYTSQTTIFAPLTPQTATYSFSSTSAFKYADGNFFMIVEPSTMKCFWTVPGSASVLGTLPADSSLSQSVTVTAPATPTGLAVTIGWAN